MAEIAGQMELAYTYPEKDGSSTSGHSGTDTSKEQATSPLRISAQRIVLTHVKRCGANGTTIAELRDSYRIHHGSLSSALTNLHRAGSLDRLEEKRDRCHVYVVPEHVNGRVTQPAVVRKAATDEGYVSVREGYKAGVARGRAEALNEVEMYVDRVLLSVLQVNNSIVPSGPRAYTRHPVPALRAIKSFVSKKRHGQ